jgi:ATP-binding protein involved in chromosome partitioning
MGENMANTLANKSVPISYGPLKDAAGNSRLKGKSGTTFEFWVSGNLEKIEKLTFITDGDDNALSLAANIVTLIENSSLKEARKLDKAKLKEFDEAVVEDALATLNKALDDYEVNNIRFIDHEIVMGLPQSGKKAQRRTIMVMSGKGGVGKSTVALNLALAFAKMGKRVGIVDVDIHGPSIPTMLNLKNIEVMQAADGIQPVVLKDLHNLAVMSVGFLLAKEDDPVIWRGPLKNSLIEQFLNDVAWGPLDYLLIDCPPGTGDEPLSVAQQLKEKAEAILVTTPQVVATADVARSVNFCHQMSMPLLGIVENMGGFVCPNCHTVTDIFRSGGGKSLSDRYDVPLLGSIPIDPSFGLTGDAGIPFVARFDDSPITKTYLEIAQKLDKTEEDK